MKPCHFKTYLPRLNILHRLKPFFKIQLTNRYSKQIVLGTTVLFVFVITALSCDVEGTSVRNKRCDNKRCSSFQLVFTKIMIYSGRASAMAGSGNRGHLFPESDNGTRPRSPALCLPLL